MKKIFLIAFVVLSANGFAQKINGRLSFQKGQKLEMVTETKKTSAMELMGQAMESTVSSTMTQVFEVEDVSADSTTIGHKVKRLVFTAEGMGNAQSFDSEKEEDRKSEMGKIMEKSLKNNYKMTVDPYGKIISIKVSEGNSGGAKKSDTDAVAELASAQLGFSLGLPKSGDASIFKILPGKEIAPGDTWTDSSSANDQKVTTVYKVNSITATDIILDYTSDISVNTTQQIMGTEASIKSTDKVTGQIILDKATGLLKQKTATIDSKATMEAQGMSLPSTGKTSITVTLRGV